MNLDWDFYFDDWLIDKVPDGMQIRIEEHPSGININPPELTCYFGANPIYMYGLGKLFHEVLMSPTGIAIYPEFLGRPGFEFVEEVRFKVDFKEQKDYWGNVVLDKHIGYVNALSYMNSILGSMYGVSIDEYVGTKTPSSKLRKLNAVDYDLLSSEFATFQVFESEVYMRDNGCFLYFRGGVEQDMIGPYDLMSGTYLNSVSPGASIVTPGTFNEILFLKYSYIELPESSVSGLSSSEFHILFGTAQEFRLGVVFDFGYTNNSVPPNYGFMVELQPTGVKIGMNDGNMHSFDFLTNIDFRFSHKFSIRRVDNTLAVIMDGEIIGMEDVSNVGSILFDPGRKNYISARSTEPTVNVSTGDIEEVAFFSNIIPEMNMEKYYSEAIPLTKKGGSDSFEYENIPLALSYDLTYTKPTEIFIPNFFGGVFDKFYLVDKNDTVKVIADKVINESYLEDYEPIDDKSIMIPNGFKMHSVITDNFEDNVDFNIGEKLPVLTRLTSDVHIPLQIYMKFKIPEFHDRKIIYNMRLILKSLDKFLWYSYKKFKTGEFV